MGIIDTFRFSPLFRVPRMICRFRDLKMKKLRIVGTSLRKKQSMILRTTVVCFSSFEG